MRLDQIEPGDVLTFWHDAGIHMDICYARVIRKGKVKVLARAETGGTKWVYPGMFNRKLSADDWRPEAV